MTLRGVLSYLWKLPLCGLSFFVGLMLSGILMPALGLTAPAAPAGTDPNTIAGWFLTASLVVALALSPVASQLKTSFLARWLLLAWLGWGAGAASVALDAALFMNTGATTSAGSISATLLSFVLPFGLLAAAVAGLFRPSSASTTVGRELPRFGIGWFWRLGLGLLAYPLIYLFFGKLVEPFIREYYLQGQFELTAPTWSQIIPMQIVRSLLFLAICLPVVVTWQESRRRLAVSLGLTLAALVGFMPVLAAYWFPWQLRFFHGLEILADSLVYAAVLTGLFKRNHG